MYVSYGRCGSLALVGGALGPGSIPMHEQRDVSLQFVEEVRLTTEDLIPLLHPVEDIQTKIHYQAETENA